MNTIRLKEEYVPVEIEMCLKAINVMDDARKRFNVDYSTIINHCLEEDFGDLHLKLQVLYIDATYFPLRVNLHVDSLRVLDSLSEDLNISYSDIIGLSVAYYSTEIGRKMEPGSNKTQDKKLEGIAF